MLMKIGEVTNQLNISHRSLRYWESVGILQSSRGENDYRYYDEENVRKIRQIILLRKLRLSIPSIQTIFTSDELSEVIDVFTEHLNETKKETEQLKASGIVLNQLLNMLRDRQDMDSVYKYLDMAHNVEAKKLKEALKTVLSGPEEEILLPEQPLPVIDMEGIGLSLEIMTEEDIPEVTGAVRRCYPDTDRIDDLLEYYNFRKDLNMPGCRWWYKLMNQDGCVGAVNLAYTGMNSMTIRNIAYMEPDSTVYIFELLKRLHPEVLCWLMFDSDEANEYCYPDCEMKKTQFREDNGFEFLTDANRRSQYQYLTRPFEQIYNSSKYRFALGLDEESDLSDISWLRCSVPNADWYDNYMGNWRITDSFVGNILFYDNCLNNGKYFDNAMNASAFRYSDLTDSVFENSSLRNCRIENCDTEGMMVDGIDLTEALEFYKKAMK